LIEEQNLSPKYLYKNNNKKAKGCEVLLNLKSDYFKEFITANLSKEKSKTTK